MRHFSLKNRHGLTIKGEMLHPEGLAKGLAFLQHGLSGHREQPHMQVIGKSLRGAGYAVVFFDSTHSFGASDGLLEKATPTTHIHDLEDVVSWAAEQPFYKAPFLLCGHSLGGLSVLHYALNNRERVKALAPLATCVSGALYAEAAEAGDPEGWRRWQDTGFRDKQNSLRPGQSGRVSWQCCADMQKYDLLPRLHEITAPVLLCAGRADTSTPLAQQQLVYDRLSGPKHLKVIEGCPHTPRSTPHLDALAGIMDEWLESL